jgi:hypothetical protein
MLPTSEGPPTLPGDRISRGVRAATLSRLKDEGVPRHTIWRKYLQQVGYAGLDDLERAVYDTHGFDVLERFTRAVNFQAATEAAESSWTGLSGGIPPSASGPEALLHMPDRDFLTAVEQGLIERWRINDETVGAVAYQINDLFERKGIPWGMNSALKFEWRGDPTTHEQVVVPALKALEDLRLGGTRDEFEAALRHLRARGMKEREDAIEESGKSVESAMKVLLESRGIPLPNKQTARPLFLALEGPGIVPRYMEKTILAVSEIRNKLGGHGAGATARDVPEEAAEAAVSGAAVAITYLASGLP